MRNIRIAGRRELERTNILIDFYVRGDDGNFKFVKKETFKNRKIELVVYGEFEGSEFYTLFIDGEEIGVLLSLCESSDDVTLIANVVLGE